MASRFGVVVVAGPSRGQRFRLSGSSCGLGRTRGSILFADDVYLSPLHATFLIRDGRLFVRDERSTSGTWIQMKGEALVPLSGCFAAGHRVFRYTGPQLPPSPTATLGDRVLPYGAPFPSTQRHYGVEELLVGDRVGRAVLLGSSPITIGSGPSDFWFPKDESLAPRHVELTPSLTGATVRDVSGGMGVFVRIPVGLEHPLSPGERLRVGEQLVQIDAL